MNNLFSESEQRERDERLTAAVTSYGPGTRSYGKSAEARESKRQMAEATERFLAQPRELIALDPSWIMCSCSMQPHKHPAHTHAQVEAYYWHKARQWRWKNQENQL